MRTWPGYFSWPPVLDHGTAVACSLIHGVAIFFGFAPLALDNRIQSVFGSNAKNERKTKLIFSLAASELPIQGSFLTKFMNYYMDPFGVRIGRGGYI